MKIFEENGKIRLQLVHLVTNTMLFDFTVEMDEFVELREHMVASLNHFKIE